MNNEALFNIPFFTFGGLHWWEDVYFRSGWKIQRNLWTRKCRLLDSFNIRRAKGSFNFCKNTLDNFFVDWELDDDKNTHLVILVHGLSRTFKVFNKLSSLLKLNGFSAFSFSYPSRYYSLKSSAEALNLFLNNLDRYKSVSFVSHNIGGILLRIIMNDKNANWKSKIDVEKIVQISPPNQGAVLVKKMLKYKIFNLVFGKSLKELVPENIKKIPPFPPKTDFGIIIGAKNDEKGLAPYLKEDNDGIINVSENLLVGTKDIFTIPSVHPFIVYNEKIYDPIITFLKTGRFNKAKDRVIKRKIEIY